MIYPEQFPFIQVVLNSAINKTTKMHIFNEKALKEIGRLYSWIGSSRWQQLQAPQAGKRRDAKGQADMVSGSLFLKWNLKWLHTQIWIVTLASNLNFYENIN